MQNCAAKMEESFLQLLQLPRVFLIVANIATMVNGALNGVPGARPEAWLQALKTKLSLYK